MPTTPATKASSRPTSEAAALKIVGDAAILAAVREWLAMLAPRPKPKLSEFMNEHARDDTGAQITPFPFQLDMADAFTDPETNQLSCRKSSRIGYSTILQSFVAWRIRYDPARTLIYQPTIDDAEKFSRDDLDPVLQWDIVREVATFKPRHADNQIRAKRYKGGWIQIKGANSPKEFRRVTADDVFLEECDGYPWASKEEGDPARLAYKRNLTSPRRFNAAGSTPKVKGQSRIDALFDQGSQEYRYVPCPNCGTMQILVFGDGTGPGIRWEPKKNPTRAWYQCAGCDKPIEEEHKAWMDENGEWRAHNPAAFPRHRSFHIWSAYSQHPGAAWLEIAREFLELRGDPNSLRTFVNQTLGEAWAEKGEAPEWERVYLRRKRTMLLDTPPPWVGLLVGSIDVQRGSAGQGWFKFSVWGWGAHRRRVLVHSERIDGNASDPAAWSKLDDAIAQSWTTQAGRELKLTKCAIDSGDGASAMAVYAWARRHPGIVMAVKGRPAVGVNQAISSPTWQDLTIDGRKVRRGVKLWSVGTAMLKLELYGLLGLPIPEKDEPEPAGWVYLPDDVTEDMVKELVSEQMVQINKRKGGGKERFDKLQERNEELDNAVYARAVAISLGVDRWTDRKWQQLTGERTYTSRIPRRPAPSTTEATSAPPPADPPSDAAGPAPPKRRVAARTNPLTGRSRGSFLSRR
jgi:phage terminase large subunit GpA-like protein